MEKAEIGCRSAGSGVTSAQKKERNYGRCQTADFDY
jgi:hypothetical protein